MIQTKIVFFLHDRNCLSKANSLELLHEGAMVGKVLPETLEDSADMVPYSELIIELASGTGMLNICTEETIFKSRRDKKDQNLTAKNMHGQLQKVLKLLLLFLQNYVWFTTLTAQNHRVNKLTSVELHEGGNQLFDGQRVVLHHFREPLSTWLYSRVGDKQHLHQLGDKVGVPNVVLAADEHH